MSAALQPGHLFFSLKYAVQIAQFIPQGAISEILFKDAMMILSMVLR